MHPFRRVLCIAIGGILLYYAAFLILAEIEAGRFVGKVTIPAVMMTLVGGPLTIIGLFPKFTKNW